MKEDIDPEVAEAIAQDLEETETPQFDRKAMEKAVAESPIAQFILGYLRKQQGPVDYAGVMCACSREGYDMVSTGVWMGRLMAQGIVDDEVDPRNEWRYRVFLHKDEAEDAARKKMAQAVAASPIAQFILEYLGTRESPINYAYVMNACDKQGYALFVSGIWTGRLITLGLVDEVFDLEDENNYCLALHKDETV